MDITSLEQTQLNLLIFTFSVIIGFVFIIIIIACIVHAIHKKEALIFTVTKESIAEQSEKISLHLKEMKVPQKAISVALLLLEEMVVRLDENTNQVMTAKVQKNLKHIQIALSSTGNLYNPFEEPDSWNGKAEDIYRDMIFYANRNKLSYKRCGKRNLITLKVNFEG